MAKKRKGVFARDIDQLNVLFAILAIASLLSVLWMIWDDYAREWKDYQRRFRVIEQEVTRQQLQDEQAQVDQQRLSQLRERRDAAEQELQGQIDELQELEARLADLQTRLDLADQNFRFSRSIYDARRYEFESARERAPEDPDAWSDEREALDAAAEDMERYRLEVEELTGEIADVEAQIGALRGEIDSAESEIRGMTREIDRLENRLEELRFDWVYYVRNAPFLNAFNPSLRIDQVVLEDVRMDLNFASAPRVDRCRTCHQGIGSAAYETYDQPFSTHPRLDLFIADTSVHPATDFGCTVCHGGKGQATSFASAVHTPDNDSEEERWEEEYGWHHVELWEWPMRRSDEVEANCLTCHLEDTWLPDAPKLEYGVKLVERLGCYGCHQIDRFDEFRKRGPDLSHIAVKTTPEWAYNWVMDPKSFRPETPMPRFFGLDNNSDEYWQERGRVEVDAIVTYLFDSSEALELESAPEGSAVRGEEIVATVGCLGCHITEEWQAPEEATTADARFTGYRQHGPNLSKVGSKTNPDWIYTWVRNPQHYFEGSTMPDLRLTEREAADVTAYLASLSDPDWDSPTIPDVDAELRDEVVLEYLRGDMPTVQARERIATMSQAEKRRYLGSELINRYGCSGCHLIPGKENVGRIGTSLSDWGSKPVTRLDFGLLDIPHERRAFLEQKLRAPRSYDRGRVRDPQEALRMPSFDLTQEEIDAVTVAILGLTDVEVEPSAMPAETPDRLTIEAGRTLAAEYNCRGCHILEERGGAIRDVIAERRMAADATVTRPAALAFAPPNLRSQGSRVQPEWLYQFLDAPTTVRPWLQVRMPTFPFGDHDLNTLTAYFATLDEAPYPFEGVFTTAHDWPDRLVREGRELAADRQGSLQCLSCHFQGDRQPRVLPSQWAPDLAMASERLRPDWIERWIENPQALQPGTNMPQFYPSLEEGRGFWPALDRDPETEIDALVAYIMSLGD